MTLIATLWCPVGWVAAGAAVAEAAPIVNGTARAAMTKPIVSRDL